MSEINFEDTIINITLGDIIQQFTEEDLQRQMPVLMQDIDAETKELVDTYQTYISAGNFAEASAYRANNPALETRIWDAFKVNSLLVYCAFAYLYAKDKKQQCIISETEPPASSDEGSTIGQVEGDIWFKIDNEEDGVINTTPFQKQADGMYKEFAIYPKYLDKELQGLLSKFEISIPENGWTQENNIYTYTVDANVKSGETYHWYMFPSNGIYISDVDIDLDFALKGMECLDGKIKLYSSDNLTTAIKIIVEGVK